MVGGFRLGSKIGFLVSLKKKNNDNIFHLTYPNNQDLRCIEFETSSFSNKFLKNYIPSRNWSL